MITEFFEVISEDGSFTTLSTDINISPSNIVATACLCSQFCTGTPYSCFSGFTGFVTVDASGSPTQTDLTGGFFGSTPNVMASNVITLTFACGAIAAGSSGWPVSVDNFMHIVGSCQVIFNPDF
jgi:hypothetical protein